MSYSVESFEYEYFPYGKKCEILESVVVGKSLNLILTNRVYRKGMQNSKMYWIFDHKVTYEMKGQ